MRTILGKILWLSKWPIALFMLWSLPAYFMSLRYFSFARWSFVAFAAGMIMFFFMGTMMDKSVRQVMQTLSHELTHAFFALLSFHKVKGLRLNPDDSGGNTELDDGNINWLIIISPYFFPLFAFLFMVGMDLFIRLTSSNLIYNGVLGYFMGYHFDTVFSQVNEKQTDLPRVSYKFCWMFLPGANLWALGSVMAFNSRGWEGLFLYQKLIWHLSFNWPMSLF